MDISVVIPLYNEEESLPELEAWIRKVMDVNQLTYEIILVDDGSKDQSWQVVEQLTQISPNVRGIKFRRNYGKSAALNVGFQAAKGEVVITMDADLQDSPDEIPDLYRMIKEGGFDMVSGWKKKRLDPVLTKNLPSKFYNWTARRMTGIKLHDFNCGLKSYKNSVVKSIEVYGDMHRYIPVLARWAGFKKIAKFGKRPMHLFGMLGVLFFLVGFGILVYLSIEKLIYNKYGITELPVFYLGILTLIVGSQLFLTGFLAELITRNAPDRNNYLIEKEIGREVVSLQV